MMDIAISFQIQDVCQTFLPDKLFYILKKGVQICVGVSAGKEKRHKLRQLKQGESARVTQAAD